MIVDFTVKPDFQSGGFWATAKVRINTTKGADAYNEWYGTEKRKGDSFTISSSSYKEFNMMREQNNLSSVFG